MVAPEADVSGARGVLGLVNPGCCMVAPGTTVLDVRGVLGPVTAGCWVVAPEADVSGARGVLGPVNPGCCVLAPGVVVPVEESGVGLGWTAFVLISLVGRLERVLTWDAWDAGTSAFVTLGGAILAFEIGVASLVLCAAAWSDATFTGPPLFAKATLWSIRCVSAAAGFVCNGVLTDENRCGLFKYWL